MGKVKKKKKPLQKELPFNRTLRLNPDYTFDTFIESRSNTFGLNIAKELATNVGVSYNPIYYYGESGTGKTHLVQSIAAHLKEYYSHLNIRYFGAKYFRVKFATAIKHGNTISFREHFRNIDMLIIEDIEELENSAKTQEELFHVVNTLCHRLRQIIITSTLPPARLSNFMKRLVNRFSQGLVVKLSAPSDSLKIKKITVVFQKYSFMALPEHITFLAQHLPNDLKQVEVVVSKLIAYFSVMKKNMTKSELAEVLQKIHEYDKVLTVKEIQLAVCRHYNVPFKDLLVKHKDKERREIRRTAMFLCRELTGFSVNRISTDFGNLSGSTVSSAHRLIKTEISQNPELERTVKKIMNALNSAEALN